MQEKGFSVDEIFDKIKLKFKMHGGSCMKVFDEKLQELQGQLARQKKLHAMVDELQQRVRSLEIQEQELAAVKVKEQADVDKLEGRTLAAFFYGLTGSKEGRLETERQEARAAAVKYDAVVFQLRDAQEELRARQLELDGLRGCEQRYQDALYEKARAIKEAGMVAGEEILRLEEEIGRLDAQWRELNEAILAGQQAKDQADRVLERLDSAEGWSTWDMFGGGFLSDLAKHDELDRAQEQTEYLQVCLNRFKTELADVTIHADIPVQLDSFTRFADFFFDGLFADWAVRDHIHQSQDRVRDIWNQISAVLERLEQMKCDVEYARASTREKLDNLILRV